jgi:SNF2 family DNA or RNA helicase
MNDLGNVFVVIGDESHAMQSLASQRTAAALALCLSNACVGCVLATGTPLKNGRPSNLLPLLIAIQHPIARNRIEFEKRYCNARKTRFCAWDTSGASNLDELRVRVGSFLMRKTKV